MTGRRSPVPPSPPALSPNQLDARFAAFVAVSALLIVTPGPDMALVTRNALRGGTRLAALTGLGVGAGTAAWAAASVLGLAVVLEGSLVAFTLMKLAGATYLLYLGVRTLLRRPVQPASGVRVRRASGSAFAQGMLNNLLNPKAAVIFVTVLPQFVRPGDSRLRLLLMLLCWELMLVAWLALYGHLVTRTGRSRAGRRVAMAIERLTGFVLIGLGLRLAFERRLPEYP